MLGIWATTDQVVVVHLTFDLPRYLTNLIFMLFDMSVKALTSRSHKI